MKKLRKQITLPEGQRTVSLLKPVKSDVKALKNTFSLWQKLARSTEVLGSRRPNMPEVISESLVCAEFDLLKKAQNASATKCSTSWDLYNPTTKERVQVKSTISKKDLSSFGPKSKFDCFYFVDFYNNGKVNGTYKIYAIPASVFKKIKINSSNVLKDFQQKGKRPRFSIKELIINKYNLQPVKTGTIASLGKKVTAKG
jgi:hypothetical protein